MIRPQLPIDMMKRIKRTHWATRLALATIEKKLNSIRHSKNTEEYPARTVADAAGG